MDSSESLQIDENLARLLAAYDQGMDGGDGKAQTIDVPQSQLSPSKTTPREKVVSALSGSRANEGSLGELLPESRNGHEPPPIRLPTNTPVPPGGSHRIGRFELRRQLGKGGCGIVFLAYDPKLEREVALKIPRPEMLLSPDARRRLIREALAAAEFDHPNLVPVYETGEIGPICFIATAFCPGLTLGEWLAKQSFPVPVRPAARLIAIVAEAVQHAHDRGVLHRDIKPNNVILQPCKDESLDQGTPRGACQLRGEHYFPRVVDFGLAKLLERGGPSDTNTRQILGTPKYMAPEQAQARHDDVGPTADVYALGVILYELLAGCAPYEGATDVEVLRQSIDGQLVPPRHIRPDIPRDLEAICLKAMERFPAKRYRTAIDLADDLHRFLDGKPTIARPLKWPGRAVRWLRRNDQVVALAVVTVVAVVLFAVGAWYVRQTRQLKDDQDRAARERDERTQADRYRQYAQTVREAFRAWRSGNRRATVESLDSAQRLAAAAAEPPDFTLRYLAALAKEDRTSIICPAGAITALAVSANGKFLASGHADGSVTIWNRATGEQLSSIRAHEMEVASVAFARDDTRIATIGGPRDRPRTGFLWSLSQDGQLQAASDSQQLIGANVNCLIVSPDGRTLYTGSESGELRSISLARSRAIAVEQLPGKSAVTSLAMTPDRKFLLVGTASGMVFRFSSSLHPVGEGRKYPLPIAALRPIGDGSAYQVGTSEGLSSSAPGSEQYPTRDRVHWIVPLANNGFAANEGPGRVVIWDGRWRQLFTEDVGDLRAAAVTRDGKTLFTGGEDGIIRSWEFPNDLHGRAVWSGSPITAIAVHPDANRVAVSQSRLLRDYFGSDREAAQAAGERGFVAIQLRKDAQALGVEFQGRTVAVRDLSIPSRRPVARFDLPDGASPISADLSIDGTRLAVGDDRGRVVVWAVPTLVRVAVVDCGHKGRVDRVALSDDGRRVAVPAPTGILLTSIDDPRTRIIVEGDDQAVFRFLPGGDRLVSADRSGTVRLWQVADGREEAAFYGHVGRVTSVGVSPDGRTIVSGSAVGEVKFWDVRTGQELISIRRHSGPVTFIEFARNGKLLVTAGNGQVAFWEAGD